VIARDLLARLAAFDPPLALMLIDFDGVIVDSEPIQHRAYAEALEPYGIQLSANDFRRYIGSSEDAVLAGIQRDLAVELDHDAVKARRAEFLDSGFSRLTEPNWFVRPALEWIGRQRGVAMVVSAGHRHRIAAMLDRFELSTLVTAIHTLPEQPPGTTKVDLVESLIGPNSKASLVIEDNEAVLRFASLRGCRTLGVQHRYNGCLDADIVVNVQP
jgi:beta-phosphoglucomutase-like phosphatase (HAD superfamily)